MGERSAGRFGESSDEGACPSDTRAAEQFRRRRPSFQEYNGTNGMAAKRLFRQRGWASGGSRGIACGSSQFSRVMAALSRFLLGQRGIGRSHFHCRPDDAAGCRDCGFVRGGCADGRSLSRTRGIALTAFGCACLTLLAYFFGSETSANATLSIIAIGLRLFSASVARATENAARRNEAEWREVFEHNPLMYFMVDAAGTVLSVNGFGAADARLSASTSCGTIRVQGSSPTRTGSAFEEIWTYAWKGPAS